MADLTYKYIYTIINLRWTGAIADKAKTLFKNHLEKAVSRMLFDSLGKASGDWGQRLISEGDSVKKIIAGEAQKSIFVGSACERGIYFSCEIAALLIISIPWV